MTVVLLLVLAAATPGPEAAPGPSQSERARMKVIADSGARLFEQGLYAQAAQVFEEGYAASKAAGFLFNAAQAWRKANDCAKAASAYARYRDVAPDDRARALAQARVEEMNACVPAPTVIAPPTEPPSPAPVATVVPPRDPGRIAARTRPWWPFLTLGLGAASTVVGGIVVGTASARFAELQSSCAPSCAPSTWAGWPGREQAGFGLLISGLVLAAFSVVAALVF